jgi:hypothetical protein
MPTTFGSPHRGAILADMQESAVTRSGRVSVSYHQFLIADLGRTPTPPFEDEQPTVCSSSNPAL